MAITKIRTHLTTTTGDNFCKSARIYSSRNSNEVIHPKYRMGGTENFPRLIDSEKPSQEKDNDSDETVQKLPYLTKLPAGTLSIQRKGMNRNLIKSKSKSFSEI